MEPSVVAFDADRDHAPDPVVLLDGHREALAGRSYTLEVTESVTRTDGTTAFRERSTVRIASDHSVYHATTTASAADGPRSTLERYANGTHVWVRLSAGNETESSVQGSAGRPVAPDAVNRTGRATILEGLYRTNVTAVVRVPQAPDRVDEPVYRIRATESTAPGASVESVSLTVTVTDSGRVLEYEYVRVRRNDTGANVTVRTPIEYRAVDDTTVRRPAWVPGNTTGDVNVGRGTVVPHRSNRSPPGRVPPVARQGSVRVRQGTEGSTGSPAPADSSVRAGSTA